MSLMAIFKVNLQRLIEQDGVWVKSKQANAMFQGLLDEVETKPSGDFQMEGSDNVGSVRRHELRTLYRIREGDVLTVADADTGYTKTYTVESSDAEWEGGKVVFFRLCLLERLG